MDQLAGPDAGLGQREVDRKVPRPGRLEERQFGLGVEDEDPLGVLDPEPAARQRRERILGVGGQVPLLGREGVEVAADLQNEQHALVPQLAAGGVLVPVGGDVDRPQVADEPVRLDLMGLDRPAATGGEILQVLQRRPVAADRGHGRPQDVLVVVEKPLAQFRHRQRLEREHRRRRGGQLGVDLGRHLLGEPVSSGPVRRRTCRSPSR